MPYDYDRMRRLPFDPKMAREIARSPAMSAEQGSGFLSGWGGTSGYQQLGKLPMYERLVYASLLEGATTPGEIEIRTGLTPTEVDRGLGGLQKKGLATIERAEL